MKIMLLGIPLVLVCLSMSAMVPVTFITLPPDLLLRICAQVNGQGKNALAQTCVLLHKHAAYNTREALLKNPAITIGRVEKHLLLLEYVLGNNQAMVQHMYDLGATNDILPAFGNFNQQLLTPNSKRQESFYAPNNTISELTHRNPFNTRSARACTDLERNVLHLAAINGYVTIAHIIIEQEEKKGEPDLASTTPLPSHVSDTPIKNRLSFLNVQDANGDTALHLATQYNQPQIVALLLAARKLKLDTTVKNKTLRTAYEVALVKKHLEIMSLLLPIHTQNQLPNG